MNEFGQYIEQHLKQIGWTQKRLAKEANVSETLISRMIHEKKSKPPKADYVKKIASALQIPIPEALHKSGYINDQDTFAFEIAETAATDTSIGGLDAGFVQTLSTVIQDDPYIKLFFDDILSASTEEREEILRDWIKVRTKYLQQRKSALQVDSPSTWEQVAKKSINT